MIFKIQQYQALFMIKHIEYIWRHFFCESAQFINAEGIYIEKKGVEAEELNSVSPQACFVATHPTIDLFACLIMKRAW